MAVFLPAAAGLAMGAFQMASANKKSNAAKRLAANNIRPTYQIPEGEYENLALARGRASEGLGDASKQFYTENAQEGLNNSLNAILKGGGDVNTVGSSFESYLDGLSRLSLLDDQQKINNINMIIQQNQRMTDQKDKAFQFNEYAPFADTAAAVYNMQSAAANEKTAGINTAMQGILSAAQNATAIQTGQQPNRQYSSNSSSNNTAPASGTAPPPMPVNNQYASGNFNLYGGSNQNKVPTGFDINYWNSLNPDQRNLMWSLYGYK